jgi:hypothetical protein
VKTFFTFCFLTIVHWQICYGQFTDNFSDNDFSVNPTWKGDDNKFLILNGELKLQAPAVISTAYLSTPCYSINNARWEFFLQMDFNPSSSNFSKVYLVSDQSNLASPLNGYFIKAGNTSDEVSLYRQDGITETEIIDGLDGRLSVTTVKVKVKVVRDASGNWQLFSDLGSTGSYTLEGSAADNTYLSSSYFGIYSKYTATRSDKFHFDNFIVTDDPIPDTIPPVLESVKVISSNQLQIVFSEKVDQPLAETQNNYSVNNNIGYPSLVEMQSDGKTLDLTFDGNFPNGISCTIDVTGVKDVSENIMIATQKSFLFFKPQPVTFKDILITEIFADPDPKIGLPEAEYIELYNRSVNPINLTDWSITDGSSVAHFPFLILFPGDYLIVSNSTNSESFDSYGRTIGVLNFPTLNNTGDDIVLKDVDDVIVDSLHYSITWYRNEDKKDGGWALELIDSNNICNETDNWVASEDDSGGTPGKQNSVFANKPDLTGPKLISVIATSTNSLQVILNERLDKQIPSTASFIIEPSIEIADISFADASLTSISLLLADDIKIQTLYTITIKNIYDCSGNNIQTTNAKMDFALPEPADSLDIVVNEILFNPKPTGVDFLEVYNKSSKYINLKDFSIANIDGNAIVNAKPITSTDILLKPSSYLVFTEDKNVLKGEYIAAHEENFFEVKVLPAFNDDEGSVVLIDNQQKVIDYLIYSKAMHSVFIKDEEGVSLERMAFDQPTNATQNWKSASSAVSYATPGYVNSNSKMNASISDESIKVDPEIFIPISGHPDFAKINYNFEQGGYFANVKIYDTQGREIKQLANNELLGAEGFFRWDGDQDNGTKARVGYYVVAFDVFNDKGIVKTFRKRVVVATKF